MGRSPPTINALPKAPTPWFVPAVQPIELFFLQRVFLRLCEQRQKREEENLEDDENGIDKSKLDPVLTKAKSGLKAQEAEDEDKYISVAEFQRAMVRLFRFLRDDRDFNAKDYDTTKDGRVGWYGFCSLWKGRKIQAELSLAERIFLTLEDSERSFCGRIISVFVFVAIVISTMGFILSTLPEMQVENGNCPPRPKPEFELIDLVCVIFFSVEYGARLILSAKMRFELVDRDKRKLLDWLVDDEVVTMPHPCKRVVTFFFDYSNLIDLAAILPGYLSMAMPSECGEDNILLRLIRLTRVIRAFRLGRRFEAVIIIMRSLRKSLRALQVLVLNLFLGMVIFGALMYFAEQGDWYEEAGAFMRWEGTQWNETLLQHTAVRGRSPFESIPACFWWAIVTATTVGYGDFYTPTTAAGKVVAGISMVWSLCVLALPIGVIGGNFAMVWEDYDKEKQEGEQTRLEEELMLKKSMAWGDPLFHSRRLLIEIWQMTASGGDKMAPPESQSEFMGEVECTLDINPTELRMKRVKKDLSLTPNYEKGRRQVTGTVTFEYTWVPRPLAEAETPDTVLLGHLEISNVALENLINLDWCGGQSANRYCKLIANPISPNEDGSLNRAERRLAVGSSAGARRQLSDGVVVFDFLWTKELADTALEISMRNSVALDTAQPPEKEVQKRKDEEVAIERKLIVVDIPDLEVEWKRLKSAVVRLQVDISDIRQDVQLILETLRARGNKFR